MANTPPARSIALPIRLARYMVSSLPEESVTGELCLACNASASQLQSVISKIKRGSHAEAAEPTGTAVGLTVAVTKNIIELQFHIWIQKPIEAQRPIIKLAAIDE